MSLATCMFLLICLLGSSLLSAPDPDKDRVTAFQPNNLPNLIINRTAQAIVIDGDLNDKGWRNAARAGNFVETFPGDLVEPPVATEVMVAYDSDNLYVAFVAEDDPANVRSSLRDRDEMFSDDYVGIMFDTYGDAALAYEIFVNPIGIQGDLRLTRNGEDMSFDMIFQSRGKITEKGYQVEIAIPFSSLSFPGGSLQEWRVNFWRNHPRDSRRRYSWASISRDDPCFVCQWGSMRGLDGVKPGKKLQVLPSLVGGQSNMLNDFDDPNSGYEDSGFDGEASVGFRYAFTPSISVEGTYNPDFSQVESDAAQVDVNTTFALFFPERRPFFQEGRDLYNTWIDVLYTRSINDPVFAAKSTGRVGRTSFGFIAARDQNSATILPFEEQSALASVGKSISNVFRLRQTFGKDSYVGAIIADRRLEADYGGSGTAFGIDGIFRLDKQSQFEWQYVRSQTVEPTDTSLTEDVNGLTFDRGRYTADYDGERFGGDAIYASLERSSRRWIFDADYWHYSPTFRADNGFVFSNNSRRGSLFGAMKYQTNTPILNEIRPGLRVGRVWNFDGVQKDEWFQPSLFLSLKKQTQIWAAYLISRERFQGVQVDGIRRLMVNLNSRFSQLFTFGFFLEHGTFVARNEDPVVLGENGTNFSFWSTFRPMNQLVIQPSMEFAKLKHPDDGRNLFNGYIARTRMSYQFTREFFLRLVLQYNEFSDQVSVEPLLTYKINPFTIFYVGSTHGYQNYAGRKNFDLTRQSQQFFFKFQYLLQI